MKKGHTLGKTIYYEFTEHIFVVAKHRIKKINSNRLLLIFMSVYITVYYATNAIIVGIALSPSKT